MFEAVTDKNLEMYEDDDAHPRSFNQATLNTRAVSGGRIRLPRLMCRVNNVCPEARLELLHVHGDPFEMG